MQWDAVSGEAGTQQAPGKSSARQRSGQTLVDLTEISNRAPTVSNLQAATEQEVASSPAMPQAGPLAMPTKSLKLKFSIGSKRAGQASAGVPSLASVAAAAAAEEPAKRKRDGAAEKGGVDEDAAPAKRQKKQGPMRTSWDPAAGAAVRPRSATPPVRGPEAAITAPSAAPVHQPLARLPSPFAGPAVAPWVQPLLAQPQPAGAAAKEPKNRAKKGRTPPPAVDPAARKALLEDVMAIAGRSPTPPPLPVPPRQPTPQPRAAGPGSHAAAQPPMPPALAQQQQKKKRRKPSDREPLLGALGPALHHAPVQHFPAQQQLAVQPAAPPEQAAKPKLRFKISGSGATPQQPSSVPALGQRGSIAPAQALAPAVAQQQPQGSDAMALPKLKKLKFTFSGKASGNATPGSSTPTMGPRPSAERGEPAPALNVALRDFRAPTLCST